jgi:hypothetical protein
MDLSVRAVPRSYKEENWGDQAISVRKSAKKRINLKGAAVQTGLEHGSRGIAIVKNRCQETTSEDSTGCKNVACALVICKEWKLAMAL